MHKSWNYHLKVGGAQSLGDIQNGEAYEGRPIPKSCSELGQHKWLTRKHTRTCRICGFHQDILYTGRFGKKVYTQNTNENRT